jgi:hypothetical protein
VGIALAEAVESGRVKVGDRIVLVAFGGGFTSGAIALTWTADPARAELAKAVPSNGGVRLPVDWSSVDPMPPRLREILAAKEGPAVPLDDVVPGDPAPAHPMVAHPTPAHPSGR